VFAFVISCGNFDIEKWRGWGGRKKDGIVSREVR